MSGSSAKASVRQIRRAFGVEAVLTLQDHEQAISILQSALSKTQKDLRDLLMAYAVDKKQHSEQHAMLVDDCVSLRADVDSLQAWRTRGFFGRLRWLVRGR